MIYATKPNKNKVKKVPVRIIQVYARYNQTCTLEPINRYEEKFQIPLSNQMTHLYLTVDPEIEVKSIQ